MCGGENKKYRRVGNECRLTRCPFALWSVCWSPVKMVYFFLVYLSRFVVVVSSNTLAGNIFIYVIIYNYTKIIVIDSQYFSVILFVLSLGQSDFSTH